MHFHCEKCFIPSVCKYIPRSDDDSLCSLIFCPYNCGVKLHECKVDDHGYLCPENVIPCLNVQYGCSSFVKRKNLPKHFRNCRAFNIECSAEWNRFPAHSTARKNFKDLALNADTFAVNVNECNLPLDFAFALNDQNKVVQSFCIPSKLRKLYRNVYTPGHPTLPLPLSKLTIDRQIFCRSPSAEVTSVSESDSPCKSKQIPGLAASVLETLNNNRNSNSCDHSPCAFPYCIPNEMQINSNSSDSDEDRSSNSTAIKPLEHKISPIRCVLCQKPIHVSASQNNADGSSSVTNSETKPSSNQTFLASDKNPLYDDYNLHLLLYPDFLGSCQPKPKSVYSFRCGKILQYGDYADHYKNLHCDIVDSLDDWIIVRCPLFYKGCDFYSYKWSLNDDSDQFVYDQWQQTFAVSNKHPLKLQLNFNLLSLPFNCLCLVASYLDPFTLNNLSLTCTILREVARSQLSKKGLVEIVWDKIVSEDGRCKWEATRKRWFFSVAYQSVRNRRLKNNETSDHLKKCKFNVIEYRDKPWPMVGTNVNTKN